jgi:hypothetical protein
MHPFKPIFPIFPRPVVNLPASQQEDLTHEGITNQYPSEQSTAEKFLVNNAGYRETNS